MMDTIMNSLIIILNMTINYTLGEAQIMPGSDVDEHGCIGSTGFTWCEYNESCVREWETPCIMNEGH
tara:strand:- start:216 stop:416 length:201 start_codon:yes stop_codon:yes gene_type:complete